MRPTLSVLIVAWNSREELAQDPAGAARRAGRRRRADRRRQRLRRRQRRGGAGSWRRRRRVDAQPARNIGFAAGCNAGAERGGRRPAGHPQPRRRRRCRASARRSAGPGSRAAAGRPGRRWSPTAAATRINSAGNPVHFTGIVWAGGHGRPIADGAAGRRGGRRVRRLPGDPAATWREVGGFPERVLPLPRGRRPLAAAAAARRRASGSSRPRWSTTTTSSAPARTSGAGSSATAWPSSSASTRPRCWSCWRPALLRHRAGAARRRARRRLGPPEAARQPRIPALAAPPAARAPRRSRRPRTISAAEFAAWLTPDLDSPFIRPCPRPASALCCAATGACAAYCSA